MRKKLVVPFLYFATLMFYQLHHLPIILWFPVGFDFLIAFGSNVVYSLPSIELLMLDFY